MVRKTHSVKNKTGTITPLGSVPGWRQTGVVKVYPVLFALVVGLAACGPKRAPPPRPQPPGAAPATAPAPAPAPKLRTDLPGLAVIHDLYAPALTPFPEKPAQDPFFTTEVARALKAHSHPGRVGAIDFDYRYGAQDVQLTNLQLAAVNTLDGERVVARFDNAGKPYEVDYDLVLTRDGWRISDVSAPPQQGDMSWGLRALLKLPPPDSEPPRRP